MKKALAAICILFLAACGTNPFASQVTKSPSPAPLVILSHTPTVFTTPTITPTHLTETPGPPTSTPFPTPTERINTPLQSGKGLRLTSIQMFDSQNGWGFDLDYHILHTHTAGKTWQDATPPKGYFTRSGFFALDAETAWATYTIGLYLRPLMAQVWHTQDGGETWEASEEFRLDRDQYGDDYPSEFYLPQAIQFIDRQTGWLLANVSYNMQSTRPLLFQTTNGGKTWDTINSRIDFPDACNGVGFVFIDAQTGWTGGNCFGQGVVFMPMNSIFGESGWSIAKTLDGGHTYEQRTMLPVPAELGQPDFLASEGNCGELKFVPIADHAIGVEWGCAVSGNLKPDHRYFALSADNGQTWTSWSSTGNESFWDAAHGWRFLAPGQIQQTADGGLTWATIKTVTWENAQFDFISEQEGWTVATIRQAVALLHTSDGGKRWSEINPVVAP